MFCFFWVFHFCNVKYIRNDKALLLLGQRLALIRKQQKLTQKQVAFEAGISDNQLRRLEKGTLNTGISTLFAVVKVFDISMKDFFDFEL